MSKIQTEPVAVGAAITTAVPALLFFLDVFNVWHATADQTTAILGLIAALSAFVAFFVRGQVSPVGPAA